MILSIIIILSIAKYIFAFITNAIPNKKFPLKIKHISHKNNHTRKTKNKNKTGTIVNFERELILKYHLMIFCLPVILYKKK